jgi:hypothetical protein
MHTGSSAVQRLLAIVALILLDEDGAAAAHPVRHNLPGAHAAAATKSPAFLASFV